MLRPCDIYQEAMCLHERIYFISLLSTLGLLLRCKRTYLDRLPRKVIKKAKLGGVIFGPPFFPSFFLLDWLGSTVNILVHEVSRKDCPY